MPQQLPLRPGDPRRLGRYRLGGRIEGVPSDDPIFIGLGPDGHEVAVSLLRGDWAHDGAARDRFAAEAAGAKRVPPFCAARVLDAGLDGPDAYLVSEYVPGPSLLELVAAEGVRHGNDLDAVAIAMATGLASVHQAGLVHGNFGPEYVIMAPDGPPRVIEYGITPPYGAATPSADMLAWAQTVVFAAAGRPPTRMDDLDVLPDHVRRPVEQCLDPDPGERPAARAVVLNLLGDGELPGGVLAEGSRRAAQATGRASYDLATYRPSAAPPGPRRPSSRQQQLREQQSRQQPVPRPEPYGERRGHGERPAAGSRPAQGGAAHGGRASHGGSAERGAVRARPASSASASPRGSSRGGGRRTVWLVAAAVVVIAGVGGVVLHLAQGARQTSAHNRLSAQTGRTASRTASPSSAPSTSLGPLTPNAFAGSWSGQVTQPPTDTYHVRVTLTAGVNSGTVRYTGVDFRCSGSLDLVTETAAQLTMNQGAKCEVGAVTIKLTGTNTIRFRFTSSGLVASGTLNRS